MGEPRRLSEEQIKSLEASLKGGDILLVHARGSPLTHPIAWVIRWGTSSHWNHASVIYKVPCDHEGPCGFFTFEFQGEGTDIRKLADYYLRRTDKYDLAVKRLAAPWYGNGDTPVAVSFANKVREFAFQELHAKYSFLAIYQIADKYSWVVSTALVRARVRTVVVIGVATALAISLAIWLAWTIPQIFITALVIWVVLPMIKLAFDLRENRGAGAGVDGKANNYVCSGFAQWSYYRVFSWFMENEKLTPDMKVEDIDFTSLEWERTLLAKTDPSDSDTKTIRQEMLALTPSDLAMTGRLKWVCFIKDGQVADSTTAPK